MLEISYNKIIEILDKNNILIESKEVLNKNINYISYDSRDIKENTLFFCKGAKYKEEYLIEAINKGSIMYVSEKKYNVDASYAIVKDVRLAMAVIALEFYKYSFKDIETIGITGTKGKTTTTYFLHNILNEYQKARTAIVSTIETYTGIRQEDSHLTTPEPTELQKIFYEVATSKIKYLTMEVASQAYKTGRAYGVEFKNGIFLNISEDHISDAEHENFEDYLSCKIEFLKHCENIVINKETDKLDTILNSIKDKKIIFYGKDSTADFYYTNVVKNNKGFSFDVKNNKLNYSNNFKIIMQGRFNVENALAAITMAKTLNIDDESIRLGLLKTEVQGRMNVFEKDGITAIVDYAHNELSFAKLYESLKLDYPNRKIISVGGAPGGKAYKRRKDFGTIVGENSDYIYLTAEDPQFEDVKTICNSMITYIKHAKYEIVEDRKKAVEKAIKGAKKGDVIVLLGKGEETYQKVRGIYTPYESDLQITKRLLNS